MRIIEAVGTDGQARVGSRRFLLEGSEAEIALFCRTFLPYGAFSLGVLAQVTLPVSGHIDRYLRAITLKNEAALPFMLAFARGLCVND